MRDASAQRMLSVWDSGRTRGDLLRRTLDLLRLPGPVEIGEIAALPVGERDARLLEVYEDLFGDELEALVRCTSCGEELEVRLPVKSVRVEAPARDREWHTIDSGASAVEFRLPNSIDLAAVAPVTGNSLRRLRLLERLVRQQGKVEEMSEEVAEKIERRMGELDPQAEICLELRCDACGAAFEAVFDVGSFLWAELDHWARRTLRDVHLLARGYGWSEDDVLRLHPWRRQMYVEMLRE